MPYVVALNVVDGTPTQWLAPWQGDPGRTCIPEYAMKYPSELGAQKALAYVRRTFGRPFPTAEVLWVDTHERSEG